jgi:hypothetical protein
MLCVTVLDPICCVYVYVYMKIGKNLIILYIYKTSSYSLYEWLLFIPVHWRNIFKSWTSNSGGAQTSWLVVTLILYIYVYIIIRIYIYVCIHICIRKYINMYTGGTQTGWLVVTLILYIYMYK